MTVLAPSAVQTQVTIDIFKLKAGEDYQLDDLYEIADCYDPALSEAFITIGHSADAHFVLGFQPSDNVPSYGKIISLFVEDETLYAIAEPIEEAVDWVKRGLYNHRSAGIYKPDNKYNPTPGKRYLRHVALLGASPPKIKGLTPLAELFSEGIENNEGLETFMQTTTKDTEQALLTDATDSPENADAFLNEHAAEFLSVLITADEENGYAGEITRFEPEPLADNNWLQQEDGTFAGMFVDESLGDPVKFNFTAKKSGTNWEISYQPANESESEDDAEAETFAEPEGYSAMPAGMLDDERDAYIAKLEAQLIGQQMILQGFEERDALAYVDSMYEAELIGEDEMPRPKMLQLYMCIKLPDYKPETDCYAEGEDNLSVFKQFVSAVQSKASTQLVYGEQQSDNADIDVLGESKPNETYGGLAGKNITLSERGMREYDAIVTFAKAQNMDITTPAGFGKAHKAYYASMP